MIIRKRGKANVVFFAANRSMWRYQKLYDHLSKDSRFFLTVVISEFATLTEEANNRNKEELIKLFNSKSVHYIQQKDLPLKNGVKSLNPDILFYIQPYEGMFGENASYSYFKKKLIAYYPYGLQNVKANWGYNTKFHNIAWRLYYPTKLHLQNARDLSLVKGKNVRVVGEPHADDFSAPIKNDPWKCKDNRKRIIWAPHFQIVPNEMFYRPSFIWTHKTMLEIAKKYQDQLLIAFKPHPRLFSELCKHPDWGEQRAKEYYDLWVNMPNTQIEDGEFVELFKTSDALIHDCGSFTAEYQYTKKPCMFLTRDILSVRQELCPFGIQCFDNHYIGQTEEEVVKFIEETVLMGIDPKKEAREQFFNEFLLPPNGHTTAENTYNDLVKSLFGDKI